MAETQPSVRENRGSPVKSAASGGSRTSINITLPKTNRPESQSPGQTPVATPRQPVIHRDTSQVNNNNRNISERRPKSKSSGHHSGVSNSELKRMTAARIIERTWLSYRDRQMFRLLKHAICAAENSLTYEILRKISPQEAELIRDPSLGVKVRFRFGGEEFPPMIYFKNYTTSKGVQYLSGKRVIKAGTEAAQDACDLMGNRKFLDQIIVDAVHHEQFKITDEIDVTTLKDYMQYLSKLDETPHYLGGRENLWRKLTLNSLPRTTIFFDVVDYLYHHRMSPRLKKELPQLLSRPITQETQLQHIKIISRLRTPAVTEAPGPTPRSTRYSRESSKLTGRRSKQAQMKAAKMRRMYGMESRSEMTSSVGHSPSRLGQAQGLGDSYYSGDEEEEEEWEREANKLYEWTQELKFEEVDTPVKVL
ncbi:putative uncharacterized protein CXorf58 [Lingula anatina]|uniref:Uncharacterized protein n=1 Tax=Lingula anatina TaxID=7574 RepID=A0A1S3JY91_LINAN|nr:putative uncharacterized protein CXorf58 [Lingula anatina]|eukprot:XP_013415353.1 putative uncharacterized protein CXorf58 [Lingula anatina]